MAATGLKNGHFDEVTARTVYVTNDAGLPVVTLGVSRRPHDNSNGFVRVSSARGRSLVTLSANADDEGTVTTYQPNGKELVEVGASDNGGLVEVYN